MNHFPVALTIAGFDSGGGAGTLADAKTFAAYGVWATAAITAVTAQNTTGVQAITMLEPAMVAAQIDSVCLDMRVAAVKTGMLGSGPIVGAVADAVRRLDLSPLVVDPIAVATSGASLLDAEGQRRLVADLFPLATVVTPNLGEVSALTGLEVTCRAEMEAAGRALLDCGCEAVLVTGGHLADENPADCLVRAGAAAVWFEGPKIGGAGAHGSGCVLSAAICAGLARGYGLEDACREGKAFVGAALGSAVELGAGPPSANPAAT